MSDEPLGDDTKPISYDMTFSNPLFDFNDDYTLCNNNLLFDEEFEDINIDLLLGEHLDTLSMGDREINFNPSRDIEELDTSSNVSPVLLPAQSSSLVLPLPDPRQVLSHPQTGPGRNTCMGV
ncbi:hypothetical protein Tco_0519795 [Tanacetum coccineum]